MVSDQNLPNLGREGGANSDEVDETTSPKTDYQENPTEALDVVGNEQGSSAPTVLNEADEPLPEEGHSSPGNRAESLPESPEWLQQQLSRLRVSLTEEPKQTTAVWQRAYPDSRDQVNWEPPSGKRSGRGGEVKLARRMRNALHNMHPAYSGGNWRALDSEEQTVAQTEGDGRNVTMGEEQEEQRGRTRVRPGVRATGMGGLGQVWGRERVLGRNLAGGCGLAIRPGASLVQRRPFGQSTERGIGIAERTHFAMPRNTRQNV